MALQLIPKRRVLPNPSLVHLFSTAADADDGSDRSRSSFASYFSDVKSSLQQQQQSSSSSSSSTPIHRVSRASPGSPPRSDPPKAASLDEIRKNLSLFRTRMGDSSQSPDDSAPPPSASPFRSLYNRSANDNEDGSAGRLSMSSIRESLKNLKPQSAGLEEKQSAPVSAFGNSFRFRPSEGRSSPVSMNTVVGGTKDLPASVFGREMREKEEGGGGGERSSGALKTEFVKMYSHEELGDKLRKLRPEGKKKEEGWFSIEELNGRLEKLREKERKETDSRLAGLSFNDLRDSLAKLKQSEDERGKKTAVEALDILGQLGKTPTYVSQTPKEHLLETYNHPDNKSAAEKMKIDLAKVREEFKMSESDCGSTRVQVALLTTKIKYLSSVLHKKDKHSRKGLVEMVHKRKRLLKYLRRTDWDSYCFVLDKLGLRDTPEHKTYDYKR